MSAQSSIRSLLPLVIGLAVGGLGVTLFRQSLPGAPGSPEERANKLELELKRANNRIAALENDTSAARRRPGRTLKDGLRNIGEDIRDGRPVTPDDIFRATQPLLRDLAPLFDRMRVREQQAMTESMTGELARKYDLTLAQQGDLAKWFSQCRTNLFTHRHSFAEAGLIMSQPQKDVRLESDLSFRVELSRTSKTTS